MDGLDHNGRPRHIKEEKAASWYIAVGLLMSFVVFYSFETYIFLSGNKTLYSLALVVSKNYAPGSIPNSGAGGGWISGPFFVLSLLSGIVGGWAFFKAKQFLKRMKSTRK